MSSINAGRKMETIEKCVNDSELFGGFGDVFTSTSPSAMFFEKAF